MRRKDREVTDRARIRDIILSCDCCRLGLWDGSQVYIVPLCFGYVEQGDRRVFYFHSARQGRKLDLIAQNGAAGFELDTGYALVEGEQACSYSARYQSVMGTGRVVMVEDPEEQRFGLQTIMSHTAGKAGWRFAPDMLRAVQVFRLEVETLTCKAHS